MSALDALPSWVSAVLIIGGFMVFGAGGVLVTQRFAHRLQWRENDIVGFVIAVVGVIYGVILAMIAIAVWERSEIVEMAITNESSAAADLYRGFAGYEMPARDSLRGYVAAYVTAVVQDEWPAVRAGGRSSATEAALSALTSAMVRHDPLNTREQWLHGQTLTELDMLLDYRRLRLEKGTQGLPAEMWLVVLAGGLITIAFTFLFRLQSLAMHVVLTALLAATMGLVIFLVYSMAEPLVRGAAVEATPFVEALETIRG